MEASDNWALKLQNLTYLYQGLETYYCEVTLPNKDPPFNPSQILDFEESI